MSGRAAALLVALTVACRAPRQEAAPVDCVPPRATMLAVDATGDSLLGPFHLTLVALTGPKAGQRADGSLSLIRADTVHYGSAELDITAVGAVPAGALDAVDPDAPGVRVFAVPGNVMLRFGAIANNMREIPFEGPYTVLRLREIDAAGFRGVWESGAPMVVASGYFCARRAG
jgi:hypothetical protein